MTSDQPTRQPASLNQTLSQAVAAHQQGRLDRADELYSQVLATDPHLVEARHMLGVLYSQMGRHAEAVRHLRRAVRIDQANPILLTNLGEAWRRQGDLERAVECYRKALELAPEFAPAHYNLANVLKQRGRLDDAVRHYQRALRSKPDHVNAHYNLANTFLEQGKFRSARAAYQRALRLAPGYAEAHTNLGIALQELDLLEEAKAAYRQAVRLKPDFVEPRRNLGLVLEKQGRADEAVEWYRQVLDLDPQNHLFRLRAETVPPAIPASNQEIDRYRERVFEALRRYPDRGQPVDLAHLHTSGGEPPSLTIYQGRDDRPLKEAWAALFEGGLPVGERTVGPGRPHIGFVVTHGHEGVFLKCMRGLINHLPADRFRLTVVCSRQAGRAILEPSITNPAVTYLPLPSRFDLALERVQEARFDLLHYWEVGTDATNYFLPLCRPAPVQCATWGWPVTSGMPTVDYFVSCDLLEAEGSEEHYAERLVRLSHLPTYYYRPEVPEVLRPRSAFGLPEDRHVYLCAQNLRKVHPDFDGLVAGILRGDPAGLVLFIEDKRPAVTALLRRRLEAALPDVVDRVGFVERLPAADYLNLTALADVALDTLHYGGGANTVYDAFAAGTPVVTWPTRFHRGRYAYAAYRQMRVPGAVAHSAQEYVDLALRLGTDPASRAQASREIAAACPALFEDRQAVTELADFFDRVLAEARG